MKLCIRCAEDFVHNDGYLCENCIKHFTSLKLFEEAIKDWIYEKADKEVQNNQPTEDGERHE